MIWLFWMKSARIVCMKNAESGQLKEIRNKYSICYAGRAIAAPGFLLLQTQLLRG